MCMTARNTGKPTLLVMTSTFPRWHHDNTPPFVQHFAESMVPNTQKVFVLAPHYKSAKKKEIHGALEVRRYRYFLPESQQNIVYEGGGVTKMKKSPLYALKLVCLVSALFVHTLWLSVVKRVNVLNPHWIVPQGFVAILIKFITRKKVVLTVHGSDIFGLNSGFMDFVKRFVLRHSDLICVNSSATRKACEKIYMRHDYHIIPMGVDASFFSPKRPDKLLAQKYKENKFTILFVGRFAEIKGIMYLCEALKLLATEGYEFKAILVGDGPLRSDVESYVNDNNLKDFVDFTGWVNVLELPRYYSIADIFVGPSLSEAQGIVFVEALASGVPVLASNVGGIPDIIHDGKNGYLFKPRSGQEIFKKLEHVITHPNQLKKMSQRAPKSITNEFSWDAIAKRYSDVMQKAIN